MKVHSVEKRAGYTVTTVVHGVIQLPLTRPDRCEYLLRRTEFKAGCQGMRCKHDCELGLPAVPAAYCQTCESYEADPGVQWV